MTGLSGLVTRGLRRKMQDSETPGKRRDWILIASLIMLAMLIFAIKEPSITGFGVQNIEDNYTANDSVENTTVDSGMAIEGITSENGSESITATQNPEQEYGILSTISNCSIISTADSYTLNQNIAGAPNSASPVTGTACIKITKSNVLFDCAGFNITNNGTAGTTYGILLNGTVTNVTVQNCPSISKYTYGVYLHTNSNNSQLLNNTAWNNSNTGFYFTGSKFNNLTNNNAYNNTNGFYFYTSCDNNNLNNNNAYNNTGYGFGFYSTNNNNTLINNSAYQNSPAGGGYSGFYLRSSSYNNLTNNTAYKNNGTYGAFYFTTSSNNNVLTNNTAYNNTNGFYLTSSSNNTFTINTVYNHTMHGFYLNSNANNNTINNNTAYNNTQYGFFIGGSSRNNNLTDNTAYNDYHGFYIAAGFSNILTSNTAYKNSYHGFYLSGSSDNTLNNNTAYNNTRHGFDLEASSNNNILTNNIAYQNNPAGGGNYAGFYLTSSNNNTLTNNVAYLNKGNYGSFCLAASSNNTLNNNTAYNNTLYGIYLYSNSNNNTLNNNTAYNNTQYGIYISSSNATTATNTHLYNNPLSDFYIVADATARTINFYNITFDNPAGNMQNYTSIDITDTLTSESYKINWSKNSTSLPVNTTSFQQKYINIVRVTGTVSIDILKWTWQSNELTGYDVNKMDLWKYNTSWTKVNSNLNTNENTLTTASLNPASTYAVVQNLRNYPYCTDDNNGLWNITSDTTISTNQICKAINIMNNAILYVNSTPTSSAVSITAENLAIYDGSSINATASGYDGGAISSDGYGPGKGLIETVTGYYYYGSGGGHGGIGGGGGDTNQAIGGAAYDNITWPTQPGSGGAGGNAGVGGKGGGAIILNITNTLNNSGSILANGQDTGANNAGTGAGGSVLINTATYTGNGTINASAGTTTQGAGGGGGRIAIYYTTNSNTGETQAYGGTSASYGQNGAAGTIYKKPASQTYGDLIIEDNNPAMPYPYTGDSVPKTPLSVTYGLPATINNINITNKASVDLTSDLTINNTILDFNNETRLDLYSVLNASNLATFNLTGKLSYSGGQIIMPNAVLTINSGGVIIHSFNNQSDTYKINLTLTNLTILPGGIINSSNAGYAGGPVSNIDGYGPGKGTFGATYWGSAAGHGGKGGLSGGGGYEEQLGGDPYDNMTAPTQSGSGGASGNTGLGGKGGGVIILNVSDTLNNSGSIVADGETIGGSANSGGGAGGSILINAGTYAGAGSTAANGGSCDSGGG